MKESSWVKENGRFIVGNDIRMRFWLDLWCGTTPLRHFYPTLFDLAVNKVETMGMFGIKLWGMAARNSISIETLITGK